MRKIIIGLLALSSLSAFANEKVTAPTGYCMQLRIEAKNMAVRGLEISNLLQLNSNDETCLGRSQICMQLQLEHQRYSQRGESIENYLQLSESEKGCLNGTL